MSEEYTEHTIKKIYNASSTTDGGWKYEYSSGPSTGDTGTITVSPDGTWTDINNSLHSNGTWTQIDLKPGEVYPDPIWTTTSSSIHFYPPEFEPPNALGIIYEEDGLIKIRTKEEVDIVVADLNKEKNERVIFDIKKLIAKKKLEILGQAEHAK